MKTAAIVLGSLTAIALVAGLWFMGSYNSMVQGNEQVELAWSQVETQYQRRFDLIPNLVNAVKGSMQQEQAVFGAIAEARTRYAGAPSGSNEKVEAANEYESAFARLLVIMENYPVLQSNQNVRALMDELAGTENRVAVERSRFNEEVRSWNVNVKSFPRNIIAGMFGFEVRDLFESAESADQAPVVDLNINS